MTKQIVLSFCILVVSGCVCAEELTNVKSDLTDAKVVACRAIELLEFCVAEGLNDVLVDISRRAFVLSGDVSSKEDASNGFEKYKEYQWPPKDAKLRKNWSEVKESKNFFYIEQTEHLHPAIIYIRKGTKDVVFYRQNS